MRSLIGSVLAASLVLLGAPVPAAAATGTTLTGVASGRCLDANGNKQTVGTPAIIWGCHGRANQLWLLPVTGDLRTFGDTRCLQAEGGRTTAGTRAVLATCTGTPGQQWRLTAAATMLHGQSGLCLDVSGARTAAGSAVILWTCHGGTNQQWRRPGVATDISPPTPPGTPKGSGLTCRTVTLSWAASSDNVGVTAYDVFHDGQLVTSVGATMLTTTVSVVPGVTWGWYVNARDGAGNVSQASATLPVSPPQCSTDTVAPTPPTGVTTAVTGTSVTLRWTAATDNVGVTAYDVLRDAVRVGTVSAGGTSPTSFTDSGLAAGRTYTYTVIARDAQDNASAPSDPVTATTGAACASAVCAVREVATDTDIPWGLVTLPDGQVLYSRRDAHDVRTLDPVTGATRSVGTVPNVQSTDGEGGLMGLAVASTFATDHWLYAMHSSATDNRIVRLKYEAGALDPASTQVLLSGILRNKFHDGGRLRFGPDGMLYASTGDAQNGAYAQTLTGTGALNGKILRMTPTGAIPGDNPFASYVWSYGHRNPQGLAFDSQGRLWQQEFGNAVMDETNLVQRGGNYGWPQCEGTVSQSGSGCAGAGLIAPKQTYTTSQGSCSGLTVVQDVVWIACGRGARLYREEISGTSLTNVQQFLVGTYGRLRTVEPAADGGLWLTTTNQGDKDSVPDNSNEKVLHLTLANVARSLG